MNTMNTEQKTHEQRPYAQSLKNFERMQPYIYAAMSVVLSPNAALNKSLKFNPASFAEPLSPETFSARFRDAVRYGVKYGYSSMLFTPQQLATLSTTMEVSMADSPFVWVYDKKTTPPFKVKEQQNLDQPSLSSEITAQHTTNVQYVYIRNYRHLKMFLEIKPLFDPTIVVTMKCHDPLDDATIDQLMVDHDCTIAKTDRPDEYIVA